ncbi:MAG: TIGR02391 family protein [Maledivibacter sp.]|nr:TIGR02391 family protein [Maledivibacter sp.]
MNKKGQLIKTNKAETLAEARDKANELRRIIYSRNIHPDIIKFCKPELVNENYFHAVFEATKSISDKIRTKSGLTEDGNALINKAFNVSNPILVINTLRTSSEKNEHNGFKSLLHGIFSMFRNPIAHEAKINWNINKDDAIDLLTTLSLLHRKLDNAVNIKDFR